MSYRVFTITVLLFILSSQFCVGCAEDAHNPSSPPTGVGSKAADFTLRDIDDEQFSLSDYEGKVIILDFWATWCGPCLREIPHFNELANEYADSGLVILGLSIDNDIQTVRNFMSTTHMDYRVAMDDGQTSTTYQSYLPSERRGYIPFTFVIDRSRFIRYYFVGYTEKEVFVQAVESLL